VDTASSIAEEDLSAIAVDVSKLESINSLGIASLYSIMKIADETGCEYVIYGLSQKMQSILGKVFVNNYVPLLSEDDFRSKYLS
jgi:anti-anti-sigma regulatory factor